MKINKLDVFRWFRYSKKSFGVYDVTKQQMIDFLSSELNLIRTAFFNVPGNDTGLHSNNDAIKMFVITSIVIE